MLYKTIELLNVSDDKESVTVVQHVLDLVIDRVLAYIDEKEVPRNLEWIVVELTIKRYHMLGSEHLNSASVEGLNASYRTDDFLGEYKDFLDAYVLSKSEPKKISSRKVRLI